MTGRRAITLVAWREIRERLRSKTFLASTLLILALVGGSALAGRFANAEKTQGRGHAPTPPGLAAALQRAAQPFDEAKVRLRVVDSAAAGRQLLEDEQVDALLLLSDDRLLFRDNVDAKAAAVADTAVRALRNELPPSPELTTGTLHPPEKESDDATTLVAFASGSFSSCRLPSTGRGQSAVVEEKNNRVVEVILSAVQARHLLAGKVIGIGSLGFAQLVLVAGLAAGCSPQGCSTRQPSSAATWHSSSPGSCSVRALRRRLRRRGRARLEPAERRYGGAARHVRAHRGLLRRLRDALEQRQRASRESAHRLPAERAARAPCPQRPRRRAALAARPRGRPRPSDDLCARPFRRSRLRPRAPARWGPA